MNKIEGDNIAGNAQGLNLNDSGWILIAILITVIILLFIISIVVYINSNKKLQKLKEFYKSDLSEKERNLLTQYRKLNDTDKNVIEYTVKSLNINHKDE